MADRISTLVIAFDGQAGSIDSVLSSIKGSVRSAVADIEATTKKVDLFGNLEAKVKTSADALFDASTKAKILATELAGIQAAGFKATDSLTAGLKQANAEVDKATTAYNRNVDALSKLQATLSKAGVDTSNVARATLQLAEASKLAAAAAAEQAAKQALGVKTLSDIQPQIVKLNAAYATLRDSGKLSVAELATAHTALTARIKETNAQVGSLGTTAKISGAEVTSFLTGLATRALASVVSVTALVSAFTSITNAAKEFQQGLAEIGTVTNSSKADIDALGGGARQLALSLGIDVQAGLKTLFDLIRSGVPKENALEVLRVSAEAAKASLTDVGTAAKVSTLLLDGFGAEAGDLPRLFDALIQGAHDGGATLKEFAEAGGPLVNVARSAKVPFNDLVAVLTVMTDASNDAAGSAAALTKIIIKLGDPDVVAKLRALGIQSTNLVDVFKELGDKGIPLQQVVDLGIASTKTAAGVSALTNNAAKLVPELNKIKDSAGAGAKALADLYDSPKERADRFNAQLEETKLLLGQTYGAGSGAAVVATKVLDNLLSAIGLFPAASKAATAGITEVSKAQAEAAAAAKAHEAAIAALRERIATAVPLIIADLQALQAQSAKGIGDLNARADADIAALDRGTKAQAATAAATIAIQTKLAADRLALIRDNEARVQALTDQAAAARKLSAADEAKFRIDSLTGILGQYQAHYAALVALQQTHVAKINSIEAERISFNEGVEKKLFDVRLQSLSGIDQYAAKVQEADRLIAAARQAGVDGDIASAKKYTDQAIALSDSLTTVINKDGQQVIGQFALQADKLRLSKAASDGYNTSLDQQDKLAKEGADATQKGIDVVLPKIKELQAEYDNLQKSVALGLDLKAEIDQVALADAKAALDELTAPRTVVITPVTGEAAGGPVGPAPQGFAAGGSVFRRPSWSKVPGVGSGDTVPALLRTGSFVMRKAASQKYGDSLLGGMARGFAKGGPVTISDKFPNVYRDYRDTFAKLQQLSEAAIGLPGPGFSRSGSLTIREWAAMLAEAMPTFSKGHDDQVKDLIDKSFDGWMGGIATAQARHVPSLMDYSLYGILKRYASGGDVVPAVLTPGEYVFKPEAVAAISKLFGGGFLPAMNALQIPAGFFDGPRAPQPRVAHYAEGGAVGMLPGGGTMGSVGGGDTHYHTWQIGQVADPENFVRRYVIPVLDGIKKRSR